MTEETPEEYDRWYAEHMLRVREVDLKQRELDIKSQDNVRSRWSNPLVLALLAAAIAAFGNAGVAYLNSYEQRGLDESKAESERILRILSESPPDQAANALRFLVETGLIAGSERRKNITAYANEADKKSNKFLFLHQWNAKIFGSRGSKGVSPDGSN